MNSILNNLSQLFDKLAYSIDHFSMETWAVLASTLLIVGLLLLRGNSIRGA